MSDSTTLARPIFILGPGRSGTTLLRSLLAAHSRIAVTPETHFLARAKQWGMHEGHEGPENFEAFWAKYTAWLRFQDLGVNPLRCRELIEAEGDHSFKTIFSAVLSAFLENAGKERIGEKTPGHSAFLSIILDWFPDARILFTQRDPRAVVASQIKTFYVKKKITPRSLRHGLLTRKREQEIVYYARDWRENFETRLASWAGDPRFYTVVYENLVQNTEEEMRAIFDFLGEDFEPSILSERSKEAVPMHAAQDNDSQMEQWRQEHHNRSVAPVSADSLDKWKAELTQLEIAIIEGCCGDVMRTVGYEPSVSPRLQFTGRAVASALSTSAAAEKKMRRWVPVAHEELRATLGDVAAAVVARGAPPSWFGYRRVVRETVPDYFRRHDNAESAGSYTTVHPEDVAENPLPCNLNSRDQLPDDRGWWGYSFWDVPQRTSGETFVATLPDCLITWFRHPKQGNDFYPAILNKDSRAIDMREVRFRPLHAAALRQSPQPVRLKKATWFIERVYHNHSHWLTAHLPKLLLLREKGMLGEVLLPPERTAAIDGSLRLLGLEPEDFQTYDPDRPLLVEELTVIGTDRFRPELLQMVPKAFGISDAAQPKRKVFISRLQAARRRLVNEDEVWALLEPQGFERVLMEDLSFEEQVALMRETAVLIAPHGAGLTNMLFCPRGAHIVEIADLGFPNPNFYALASAMGHNYWLVSAESLGDLHPLEKDLRVDPAAVSEILPRLTPSFAA